MRDTDAQRPQGEQAIQLCSVRAAGGLFGVDTRAIREVLGGAAPQRVPLAPDYIAGALTYRGEILEAVCLRTLLGLGPASSGHRVLVIEDPDGERFGLMVDCVDGMLQALESELEPNPATLEARCEAIFDGVFRLDTGLMTRLDPIRLRPAELAQSGVFETKERRQ